jgi:hypothetical protein
VIDADDGDGEGFMGDAKRLLGSSIDTARYPILAAALAAPDAPALRRELMELLAPQLRARAPRRSLRVMCRLQGQGYDEPVLITDISASGVRFLVQSDVPIDLTQFDNMHLQVRVGSGPRSLAVALVRRCGGDKRHTDLACRFLERTSDHQEIAMEIRNRIFGDEPPVVAQAAQAAQPVG